MNDMVNHLRDQIIKLLKGKSAKQETNDLLSLKQEVWDEYFDDEEWERFEPGVVSNEWSDQWYQNIQDKKIPLVKKINWVRWASVAAACIVVMSMIFCFMKDPHQQKVATTQAPTQKTLSMPEEVILENKEQQLKICMLPDGSKVELSGGSRVRYINPMEKNKRSIWLEGEAVFHVRKDLARPFTVYANNFATTALGTVFRVSSFKEQNLSGVQLISGKIKVVGQNEFHQIFYLSPGEQCIFNAKENVLKKSFFKKSGQTYSKQIIEEGNSLNFNNTPLPDVIRQIEAAYNIHILFNFPSAGSMKFTGSFTKTDSLDEILETLALLNDLQMKKVADTIYMNRK